MRYPERVETTPGLAVGAGELKPSGLAAIQSTRSHTALPVPHEGWADARVINSFPASQWARELNYAGGTG